MVNTKSEALTKSESTANSIYQNKHVRTGTPAPPQNINQCNQECSESHYSSMLDGGLKGQGSQRPKTRQMAKGYKSQLRGSPTDSRRRGGRRTLGDETDRRQESPFRQVMWEFPVSRSVSSPIVRDLEILDPRSPM